MKCYILNRQFALRGWKLLPYAIQNLRSGRSEFMREKPFALLRKCDGRTPIDPGGLDEEERKWFRHWLKNYFILEAKEGDALAPEQEYRYYDCRFKEGVQWSITGKCNFRCKHCFMSAPYGAQGEPDFGDCMKMLDAFERAGIKRINITGGEPLVRKDFWQIIDAIRDKNLLIPVIYSNGWLVTDEFLDRLKQRNLRPVIQISFDGVGYHNWLRGVPDAEEKTIEALRRCREKGFPTTVSTILTRESVVSIRETVNLMADLGVRNINIGVATPMGEWKNQREHYLTEEEMYEAFLEYIPRYFEDRPDISLSLGTFFRCNTESRKITFPCERNAEEEAFGKIYMCGHVRREMYVSPTGNVLPCMSMIGMPIENEFPNMLEIPLEDILDNDTLYIKFINYRVSDFLRENEDCRECEYRAKCCGGCRALALTEDPGRYLGKDGITCRYFKNGWMDKKNKLIEELKEKQDVRIVPEEEQWKT
jgi:radical SAM protein with 4Fe4S-binding SPASM domain